MTTLQIAMSLVSSAMLLGYISSHHLKIQPTIAILGLSVMIVTGASTLIPGVESSVFYKNIMHLVDNTNFHSILIDFMLPILLFAGSVSMNSRYFLRNKYTIASLAFISTILSTIIVGYGFHLLCQKLAINIDLTISMIFGALISPTDPVAVVGMIKKTKLSPDIEASIAGESLFNDGIGIVIFLTLYELAFGQQGEAVTLLNVTKHFCYEAIGGCIIGYGAGLFCRWLIQHESKYTHNHILISVFVVTGVYTLANSAGFSGPLAIVICGLMISHHTATHYASHHLLYHFWETLEEILNMVLYLLIGFEALLLPYNMTTLWISLASISLILFSRSLTVGLPVYLASHYINYDPKMFKILVWGGLRGGLAVALALSLPEIPEKAVILIATYAVVCFTTIVQGGSMLFLLNRDK